ncbi:mitochondrial metalloendopeptidase OMA1-like [Apium graveolens]|uniref:mitochondrial metalloendopeptidase OMA1-like n=1 Tax=Apium graveolens TaxID=4045 RepID=UPI003D7BCF8B
MASAGYDPREAPKVYRMFDNNFGKSSDSKHSDEDSFGDIFSTHPSGRKRAEELSKSGVMEEAMTRYSEVIETRRRKQLKDYKRNISDNIFASFFRWIW